MEYVCLNCMHKWISRGETVPRQCPACWSRSIASLSDIRLASILLKPWTYLSVGRSPPLPLPQELLEFPASLFSYSSVMASTRGNPKARENALRLILAEAGFSKEQIEEIMNSKKSVALR